MDARTNSVPPADEHVLHNLGGIAGRERAARGQGGLSSYRGRGLHRRLGYDGQPGPGLGGRMSTFPITWVGLLAGSLLLAAIVGCRPAAEGVCVEGSDTMVNLAQGWAENYHKTHPEAMIQISGGGTGVGIASLIDGNCEIASASRKMKDKEIERVRAKTPPGTQRIHRRLRRPGRLRPQGQPPGLDLHRRTGRDLRRRGKDHPLVAIGRRSQAVGQ